MMVTMVTRMGNDGYNGYTHGEWVTMVTRIGEWGLQWLHAWGMGLQWLHAWGMMVTMVTRMGNDGYNGYMHGE